MADSDYVLILTDRRVTKENISKQLWISLGRVCKIVHNDLALSKVSCHWVHKMLTLEHKAARIVETISQFGYEQLLYPPYSPDLVPSDFYLFGLIKEFLCGTKFSSDEVKSIVNKLIKIWFSSTFGSTYTKTLSRDFYAEGIQEHFFLLVVGRSVLKNRLYQKKN